MRGDVMRVFGGHFGGLLRRFGAQVTLVVTSPGSWDAGRFVPGEPKTVVLRGAVAPGKAERRYGPGGSDEAGDLRLYLDKPLPAAMAGLEVTYKRRRYTVEEAADYSDYGDLAVYRLRRVDGGVGAPDCAEGFGGAGNQSCAATMNGAGEGLTHAG